MNEKRKKRKEKKERKKESEIETGKELEGNNLSYLSGGRYWKSKHHSLNQSDVIGQGKSNMYLLNENMKVAKEGFCLLRVDEKSSRPEYWEGFGVTLYCYCSHKGDTLRFCYIESEGTS